MHLDDPTAGPPPDPFASVPEWAQPGPARPMTSAERTAILRSKRLNPGFWRIRPAELLRPCRLTAPQSTPRLVRVTAPRTREGHGRPRQANAPPSDDPDPSDPDGLTLVQWVAARRTLAYAGWSPEPLTITRYQAAWLRIGGVQ